MADPSHPPTDCPLRVAILVDSLLLPACTYEMLVKIAKIDGVKLVLAIVARPTKLAVQPPYIAGYVNSLRTFLKHCHDWVYHRSCRIDECRSVGVANAFASKDSRAILVQFPQLIIEPDSRGNAGRLGDADLEIIYRARPEVILQLGSSQVPRELLALARFGSLSLRYGSDENENCPPGVWEVLRREPIARSMLTVMHAGSERACLLFESVAATDQESIFGNKNHCCWKTSQFIPRQLKELVDRPPAVWPPLDARRCRPSSHADRSVPGNSRMLLGLSRLLIKKKARKLVGRLFREQWFIAYRMKEHPGDPNNVFEQFIHLSPPNDRYWADPFPVRHDGHYYLFFEEFIRATRKGRIVVTQMLSDGTWDAPRTVLERSYHLSYPYVFCWQDQWFMVPETAANQTVELWRCQEFPHGWVLDTTLMKNVRAVDSTLIEIDGRWWLFTCMAPDGANAYDALFLFHADDPRGPWMPHRQNPIVSDARHARPAGRPFCSGGKWLRPSQDCTGRYGRRVVLREIDSLTPEQYREKEATAIEPKWSPGLLATHTLNEVDDLTVIDGCKRRFRLSFVT